MDDFATTHLEGDARILADIIVKSAKKIWDSNISGGGCKAFHTPKSLPNDSYAKLYNGAVLVVHFDGGDLHHLLSYDSEVPDVRDSMVSTIEKHGYFVEDVNNWSMAIYKNGPCALR